MQAVPASRLPRSIAGADALPAANRWLLLVLQLPARPSNARVKTWRRLQQLGAIPVKHAVYVLPNSAQGLEDFEWLGSEIEALGGQATVFTASSVEGVGETELIRLFQTARAAEFKDLLARIRAVRTTTRRAHSAATLKHLRLLRDRLEHLKAIDFFPTPGAGVAEAALVAVERAARPRPAGAEPLSVDRMDRRLYRRRTWVTRPRPGVDRFASAWLIQRFIDPEARFAFASSSTAIKNGVAFDMYDGGFKHEGHRCTFEVLQVRFGIDDPLVRTLGELVHNVDLKDDCFRAPEGPAIATLVDGLRASFSGDTELLRHGVVLFDALYAGLRASRPGPKRRAKASSR